MTIIQYPRRSFLQACLGLAVGSAIGSARAGEPGFRMRIGGKDWIATRSMAVRTTIAGALGLNINGFIDGPKISHVSFLVYPPAEGDFVHAFDLQKATAGDMTGKVRSNTGGFNADMLGGNPLENDCRFFNGKLTITAYDASKKLLSGTFAGLVRNHNGGPVIEITDGQFSNVDLTP